VNRHRHGWAFARDAINVLFFWQMDHCRASYQRDVDFARQLLTNRSPE